MKLAGSKLLLDHNEKETKRTANEQRNMDASFSTYI